jgi:4-amino-4-deoxychorismate lyase
LKGVVTDPALMVIPFDDHIVHRGHGISIRPRSSPEDLRPRGAPRSLPAVGGAIEAAAPGSRAEMTDIIVQTAAASGRRDGRFATGCRRARQPGAHAARGAEPGFFVMIFAGLSYPERWYTEGLRVMTTTYPIKAPLYAITKATNYLPNVLMQMEAKEKGFDNGVFIDEDGNVGESSNMNVAFVTRQGVLVHPKFDHILSGCTSLRLLELARAHRDRARVTGVEVRDIAVAEARASREMLQLGSSIKVAPVVQWDDQAIGRWQTGSCQPCAASSCLKTTCAPATA